MIPAVKSAPGDKEIPWNDMKGIIGFIVANP